MRSVSHYIVYFRRSLIVFNVFFRQMVLKLDHNIQMVTILLIMVIIDPVAMDVVNLFQLAYL